MRLVVILWIALLGLSHAYAADICAKQSFGYKAVDSHDSKSYFLCLGLLGKIWSHCDDGFRFNGSEQKCILEKQSRAGNENSGGPNNVFNINQNITMHKPLIFNIFGPLWKPSNPAPPLLPAPATTEEPVTISPGPESSSTTSINIVSSPSSTTDSSTESSSSSVSDSSTESSTTSTDSTSGSTSESSSSATESSTESSSSLATDSTTEISSTSTDSNTESSSSTSTESSTESSSSLATDGTTEISSSTSTDSTTESSSSTTSESSTESSSSTTDNTTESSITTTLCTQTTPIVV